jgi:O-antigen ligase
MSGYYTTADTSWMRADSRQISIIAGIAASIAVGLGLAVSPFLALGVVLGIALLIVALLRPLYVIAGMIILGPIDLSFVTGGFKNLFPELGGLDMNGIRLVGLTIAFSALVLGDRRVLARAFSRHAALFMVFLLYAASTLVRSPAPVDGARLLLKLAFPFFVFVTVSAVVTTRRQLDRLIDCMLIGAAAITVFLNPLYVMAGGYEVDYNGWVRIRGAGTHQNPFSFYLVTIILVAFVRYIHRGQIRYLVLCAIAAVWMTLTITRITLLASMVSLGSVALYAAITARQYRALFVAGVIGSIVAFFFVPPVLQRTLGYMPTVTDLLVLAAHPQELFLAVNWEGREAYWAVVFAAYLAQPLFGLGLGASTAVIRENFPSFMSSVVHNEYLRLLSDTGALGVALFAGALLVWLFLMLRLGRSTDQRVREYAVPAIGVLIAWSIISITDNALDYYAAFTQYAGFLCGGAVAAAAIQFWESDDSPHGSNTVGAPDVSVEPSLVGSE